MGYSTINVYNEIAGIAKISLSRERYSNAYNEQMLEELLAEFDRLSKDPLVRVVLIEGEGKNFQSGADINWLREVSRSGRQKNNLISRLTCQVMRELDSLNKPTVAIVQGYCGGGGTGLIAACDIVIAEETATFSISEARWGVSASIIFPILNASIGTRNVRRYALTTERFDANQARTIGLVHEVVKPGKLGEYSDKIIREIVKLSPAAVEKTKEDVLRSSWSASTELFDSLSQDHATIRQSPDAKEGFSSFVEKRAASWEVT